MKAGGALVLTSDPGAAAARAVAQASEALGDLPPSLAVLFASAHFLGSAEALVAAVAEQAGPLPLIGCVGQAVAGGAREVESDPAVSLWLGADLGPVESFAMEFIQTPSVGAYSGYRFDRDAPGMHLMICDPYTFPADGLLAHLNEQVPGALAIPPMTTAPGTCSFRWVSRPSAGNVYGSLIIRCLPGASRSNR